MFNYKKTKYLKLIFGLLFVTIPFVSVGYSALQTTLNISGDFLIWAEPTLYNVMKAAAEEGVYAKKYIGSHQDSVDSSKSTENIYYWDGNNSNYNIGHAILEKNNVVFAGFCWQMIRTTDTGGVRLVYNGEPITTINNGVISYDCSDTRPKHFSYNEKKISLSGSFYYGDGYMVNGTNFSLQNPVQVTINNSNARTEVASIKQNYPYTCRNTNANGTCSTLYQVSEYSSGASAYAYETVARDVIGKSAFSSSGSGNYNNTSIGHVGYMTNGSYLLTDLRDNGSSLPWKRTVTMLSSVTLSSSNLTTYGNYYYGDGYTVTGTNYSLQNPVKGDTITDFPQSWQGLYRCNDSTRTSCNSLYYISGVDISGNTPVVYHVDASNGKSFNDASFKYLFGDELVDNGDGTFSLSGNVLEIERKDWYSKYSLLNNKFVCLPGYYTYDATTGISSCNSSIGYVTTTTNTNFSYNAVFKYGYGIEPNGNDTYKLVGKDNEEGTLYYLYNWNSSQNSNCFANSNTISDCNYSTVAKSHYTCFNLSGVCSSYSYISTANTYGAMVIRLSGGKILSNDLTKPNNIIYEQLYKNGVNNYSSPIKTFLETWYSEKIFVTGYDFYVDDTIYCNDRTISSFGSYAPENMTLDEPLVFKEHNSTTDLSCLHETDQFSLFNPYAKLTYKVGLLSSPEFNLLNSTYLRASSNSYWLMSPDQFYQGSSILIGSGGNHIEGLSYNSYAVKPVISLKSEVEYSSGDGSMHNPYVIDLPPVHSYILPNGSDSTKTFGKNIPRSSFESISTVINSDVPLNVIDSWDASAQRNGSVMVWYTDSDSNGLYELYIGQDGGVVANPDSSYAFAFFENASNVDLSSFRTGNTLNMSHMFQNTGSNATSIIINGLSYLNTSKVNDMSFMFYNVGRNASTTKIIGIENWNVHNVVSMESMFEYCGYMSTTWEIGYLNYWEALNVTNMKSMFAWSGSYATTWNIGFNSGTWSFDKVTDMSYMFYHAGENSTTWKSINSIDVFADNISSMFMSCPKAKIVLNIRSNPSSYTDAFNGASIGSERTTTVNYVNITTNIDDIIATKSSNSNVVKGRVIS